jgi:transcriptional regulator with XRE-family HTH domain
VKGYSIPLATTLRRLRRDKLVSQEELAHRADIHRTYMSQLERGLKSPTLDVVGRLATALDMGLDEFVTAVVKNSKKRRGK